MRIVIARDEAFSFLYTANVDALRTMGEVEFFSPLHDHVLPHCDLLYLPGGYPELFLDEIEANDVMRRQVRDYAERGGRVFAECGGFMYLCHDIDGRAMCGVFDLSATMAGARLHLGYRERNGAHGHEFHYSDVPDSHGQVYIYNNVLAGYTHWYWAEKGFEDLWKRLSER